MWNGDISSMMGQIQNFQKKMAMVKEDLRNEKFRVSSSCVEVLLNGIGEVMSVSINGRAMENSKSMLEEQVVKVINDGIKKARQKEKDKMGELFREMNIPNIPGLTNFF